jgi:hypothetical protein
MTKALASSGSKFQLEPYQAAASSNLFLASVPYIASSAHRTFTTGLHLQVTRVRLVLLLISDKSTRSWVCGNKIGGNNHALNIYNHSI